jgi:1-acyl-sn-glycerol-3-phosphate acyltransferase
MPSSNSSIMRHLASFVSFVFITANLLLWLPLLLLAAITRICLPFDIVKKTTYRVVEGIYRLAVIIDAWWIIKVLGIEFEITDEFDILGSLSSAQNPVVICNHQSWFDVFLLQTLISGRGPILKFVIKVELLWVPVLGWICLALNFPRLNRKGDAKSRSKDLKSMESASLRLGSELGALLIFPEGTRFSSEKRDILHSPYQHLLPPRRGGFNVIQQSMPTETSILDVIIRYEGGDANCWRCMSGAVDRIYVRVDSLQMRDVHNTSEWLNQRWLAKDTWLANPHKSS